MQSWLVHTPVATAGLRAHTRDMTPRLLELLATTTTLGTAVVAGVFFTFSSFVMPGLARLPAAHGLAAMQAINVAAITRSFMGLLFGTAALCVVLVAWALLHHGEPGRAGQIVGATTYLLGAIVVTIVCNVPRNDALARVAPESVEAGALWADYLREWMAWNHVRAVTSSAAAVVLLLSRP